MPDADAMSNATWDQLTPSFQKVAVSTLLGSFSLFALVGNGFVIAAVYLKPYLQTPTSYLIVSLALADLIVGLVVMPFSVAEYMLGHWPFGLVMCDIWHCFDILASTASVWNLAVISMDRYLAVRDPLNYRDYVTPNRICILIVIVWFCSLGISFPAIAWWRQWEEAYSDPKLCRFPDDMGYIVLSSVLSFYLPLALILFAYARVFAKASFQEKSLRIGHKRIKNKRSNGPGSTGNKEDVFVRMHRGTGASRANQEDWNRKASAPVPQRYSLSPPNGMAHYRNNSAVSLPLSTPARRKISSPAHLAGQDHYRPLGPLSDSSDRLSRIRLPQDSSDSSSQPLPDTLPPYRELRPLSENSHLESLDASRDSYQCLEAPLDTKEYQGLTALTPDAKDAYKGISNGQELEPYRGPVLFANPAARLNNDSPTPLRRCPAPASYGALKDPERPNLERRREGSGGSVVSQISGAEGITPTESSALLEALKKQEEEEEEEEVLNETRQRITSLIGSANPPPSTPNTDAAWTGRIDAAPARTLRRKMTKAQIFVKLVKEKRAAKTLGLVVGCFIVCWCPFMLVNVLLVICRDCVTEPETLFRVVTWLGYANSFLNPVIYTLMSRDFKRAFQQMICTRRKELSARKGLATVFEGSLSVMFLQYQAQQGSQTANNSSGRQSSDRK